MGICSVKLVFRLALFCSDPNAVGFMVINVMQEMSILTYTSTLLNCALRLLNMTSVHKPPSNSPLGVSSILGHEVCESYLLFPGETAFGEAFRTFLYCLGLAYCFIGLSAITARFFRSMENVVKQTREVVETDPYTNSMVVRREKVWNYTIADITLLAFGTSFPQISLATIDALRNLGDLYAGGSSLGLLYLFCLREPFTWTTPKIH